MNMNPHFETFLDQQYFSDEKNIIINLLNEFGWLELISTRIGYLFENKNPEYSLVATTMIQSINDNLRVFEDINRKEEIENVLARLFRDLIAYLLQVKEDFYPIFPNMVEQVKKNYELNNDNFPRLNELIDFDGFLTKMENSQSISTPKKTRYLKWVHSTSSLKHFIDLLENHGVIPTKSNFEELFQFKENRLVYIVDEKKKRFALIIDRVLSKEYIKPIGGKATWDYLESNITLSKTNLPLKKGYLRKTVSNNKNEDNGAGVHEVHVNDFIEELEGKSRQ